MINTKTKRLCQIFKETVENNKPLIIDTNNIIGCGYGKNLMKRLINKPYLFIAPSNWFINNNLTEKIELNIFISKPQQAYLLAIGFTNATGNKIKSYLDNQNCGLHNIFIKKNTPWLTESCAWAKVYGKSSNDEIWIGMDNQQVNLIYQNLKDYKKIIPNYGKIVMKNQYYE